ncbi:MAG: cell division protein FtsZ, partial [Duodenibacillus sp.]|nr:cell division protein FtsZ [Duodenibacillus sp.]
MAEPFITPTPQQTLVPDDHTIFSPCIKVIGVGGGGGNAVDHMVKRRTEGVLFIAANSDHQILQHSQANVLIPLGRSGLGCGGDPQKGEEAANAVIDQIREAIEGAHLLFITAGMGGGTGTGAAPVIARIAKDLGILTVGVVTKPFDFEGRRRMRQAEAGIEELRRSVDSLIVILNDKLQDQLGEDATMEDCFAAANDVLWRACGGVADIINTPGLVNVDFEDLRSVMSERGKAMMGMGTASGPNRAREAAESAINCPLLEGINLQGARALLVYITAAHGVTMKETREVMAVMRNFVSDDANIIQGSAYDDEMGDSLRVTVVATGLDSPDEVPPALAQPGPAIRADVWNAPSANPAAAEPPRAPESALQLL